MAISGLVLILEDDARRAEAALAQVRRDRRFTLGPPQGRRIPVVLETPSQEEDRDCYYELMELDGIAHVDVVMVGVDVCEGNETAPRDASGGNRTRRAGEEVI